MLKWSHIEMEKHLKKGDVSFIKEIKPDETTKSSLDYLGSVFVIPHMTRGGKEYALRKIRKVIEDGYSTKHGKVYKVKDRMKFLFNHSCATTKEDES